MFGHTLANRASRILRLNAWINILFGCLGLFALVVVLAPWGIGGQSLFKSHEMFTLIMALVAFAGWAVTGIASLKRWQLAALCPLALALCVGKAIPESVQNANQPEVFVSKADFRQWLASHRLRGPVSLVLLLARGGDMPDDLPLAQRVYREGRLVLLQYGAAP